MPRHAATLGLMAATAEEAFFAELTKTATTDDGDHRVSVDYRTEDAQGGAGTSPAEHDAKRDEENERARRRAEVAIEPVKRANVLPRAGRRASRFRTLTERILDE